MEERPFERLRSPSQILQRKEMAARSFSKRFSEASHRNAFLIEKIPFWPIACMYRISACMTMSDNLSELASRVNSIDIRTDRLQKWARLSNPHCGGTPLQGKHADFRPQTVKVKTGAVVLRCDAVRVDSWTEFEFLVDISRMSHHRTATAPPPRRRVFRPYRSRVGAIKETIRGNDPRCRVSDAWTAIPESADTKTLLNRQARLSNGEEGNWFLSPSLPGSVLIAKPVSRGL